MKFSTDDRSLAVPRGFTLVELLLVVGVIALGLAILFPVVSSVRANARRMTCSGNLRQLGLAYQIYVDDHGSYPGPQHLGESGLIRDRRILFCPDDATLAPRGTAASYALAITALPDYTPIWESVSLDPSQVLASCDHHLGRRVLSVAKDNIRYSEPGYPFHMVLRAGGAVGRVPLSQVRRFSVPGFGRPAFQDAYPGEPGYDRAEVVKR